MTNQLSNFWELFWEEEKGFNSFDATSPPKPHYKYHSKNALIDYI